VSLNAAIFASVLLASRLPSNLHVFALISIAIEVFALFPIMRHHLKVKIISLALLICLDILYRLSQLAYHSNDIDDILFVLYNFQNGGGNVHSGHSIYIVCVPTLACLYSEVQEVRSNTRSS
jgi:hypothetical protein